MEIRTLENLLTMCTEEYEKNAEDPNPKSVRDWVPKI